MTILYIKLSKLKKLHAEFYQLLRISSADGAGNSYIKYLVTYI